MAILCQWRISSRVIAFFLREYSRIFSMTRLRFATSNFRWSFCERSLKLWISALVKVFPSILAENNALPIVDRPRMFFSISKGMSTWSITERLDSISERYWTIFSVILYFGGIVKIFIKFMMQDIARYCKIDKVLQSVSWTMWQL